MYAGYVTLTLHRKYGSSSINKMTSGHVAAGFPLSGTTGKLRYVFAPLLLQDPL